MFPWYQLIFTPVIIVLVYYVVSTVLGWSQTKGQKILPPVYGGWLPWLGCAFEFGKSPLTFIEAKRKQLGSVFTLKVAGERMTFLTDPTDFPLFFRSSNVDFQKAVQNAVQNVASVTEEAFFQNHTRIHDTVKGRLAAGNLSAICQTLFAEFKKHLSEFAVQNGSDNCTQIDLNRMVRSTMYKSVMNNLFGKGILPIDQEESFKELEKNFVTFDDQFEYGARLPPIFLKEWSSAKKWLLSLFSKVVTKSLRNMPQDSSKQTLLHALLSMVEKEYAANWSLMLLWASLANAIPITFWTLALIYTHPEILKKVQAEVDAVFTKEGDNFSENTLTRMPYAKQCILEAIRLRSPGIITRRVVQEFTAQGYTVPPGDLVMVSPYWAHRNPQAFPEPDTFKPCPFMLSAKRGLEIELVALLKIKASQKPMFMADWLAALQRQTDVSAVLLLVKAPICFGPPGCIERWDKMDKNSFPEEFIAFGGGRYQCPGRWFALMEIHMYVTMFINMFDCKLLKGVPDLCELHLVGTQQPVQSCPVEVRKHSP